MKPSIAETTTKFKKKHRVKALVPSHTQAYLSAKAEGPQQLGQRCPGPGSSSHSTRHLPLRPGRPWPPSCRPRRPSSLRWSGTCRQPSSAPAPWPAASRSTARTWSARRPRCSSWASDQTTSASKLSSGEEPRAGCSPRLAGLH